MIIEKKELGIYFVSILKNLILVLLIYGLSGCDLLDVKITDRVSGDVLNDPAFAETMVLGAEADFDCFYTNYVIGSGTFTDETYASTSFVESNQFDSRNNPSSQNNTTGCVGYDGFGIYLPMHRAVFTNQQAVRKLEGFEDGSVEDKNNLIAKASAYAGFALTMQGEGYCRGVAKDSGPALTPTEVLAEAEKRFNKAIDSTTDSTLLNMALVGRARARLGQGDLEGAASDAKKVTKGFEKYATYSQASPDRENQIFVTMVRNQFESVEPQLRQLQMLNGVKDPRVNFTDEETTGPDGRTPLWSDDNYTKASSPILLASWDEAQLIIAEAKRGQVAVNRINALRDEYGLPHFESTDKDEILNQIIEERQRELHLTGHRLGDKRRLNIKFKEGQNHKGTYTYGSKECIPLARTEINQNPNISE